jgi:hypothetical protein
MRSVVLLALLAGAACSVGSPGHLTPLGDAGNGTTSGTTGTGGAECGTPSVKVDPLYLDFGRVIVQSTVTLPLTITNTSACPITLSQLELQGESADLFAIPLDSSTYTTPIPPGESVRIAVSFSPMQPSTAEEIAQLIVDYAPGMFVSVGLRGLGVSGGLCVAPTSAFLSFGNLAPGQSVTKLITIENCGNETVQFYLAYLRNSDGTAFSVGPCPAMANCTQVLPGDNPYALNPGDQLTYPIIFTPTQAQQYVGSFAIEDEHNDNVSIQLSGGGVESDAGWLDAGSVDGGAMPDAGGDDGGVSPDGSYFGVSVALASTSDTWNLETADFNADGIDDLIQGTFGGVVIYLQLADGGFSPNPVPLPNGAGGLTYAVPVDLDGDGWMDFVATNGDSNTIDIEMNQQDGGFAFTEITLDGGGYETRVGDFDSDGQPDLALCGPQGEFVFFDDGGATSYRDPIQLEPPADLLGGGCWNLVVGDLNGDGIPDIVALVDGPRLVTYLANGDGGFSSAAVSTSCNVNVRGQLAIADLNGDGLADVVCGSPNGISVHFGVDAGQLGPVVDFSGGNLAENYYLDQVVVADFDGDGLPDVAAAGTYVTDCGGANVGSATLVFYNDGGGQFEPSMLWTSRPQLAYSIAAFRTPGASLESLAVADYCNTNVSIFPHLAPDGGA